MVKKNGFQAENGITLIESVLVLTIALVLATLTLSNFIIPKNIYAAANVIHEFKGALNRAKSDSIRRNAKLASQQAHVTILSDNSYSITADHNRDGKLESNEIIVKTLQNSSGEKFLLTSANYPIKISFDWRGRVTATDSTNSTVVTAFSYCSNDCPANLASADSTDKYIYGLTLSPMGDAKISRSVVSSVPTLTPPTVTTVTQAANSIRNGTNSNVY